MDMDFTGPYALKRRSLSNGDVDPKSQFSLDEEVADFAEEINYVVVKNSYFLTINSIESKKSERFEQTNERFRTFVLRHPQSKYSKELSSYLDKLSENNN